MQRGFILGFKKYVIRSGEERHLYKCNDCDSCFSETINTVLEDLRTSISRIIMILTALSEGMGINALTRTFFAGKNTPNCNDYPLKIKSYRDQLLSSVLKNGDSRAKISYSQRSCKFNG